MKFFVLSVFFTLTFLVSVLLSIALLKYVISRNKLNYNIRHFLVQYYTLIPFKAAVGRFLFLSFYLIAIAFLKSIDVSEIDYEKVGFLIIGYSFARVILMIYIMMICFGAGSLLLKGFYLDFRLEKAGVVNFVILGFFFGASIYGITIILVGFAGMLNLLIALLLTVPILWAAYPLIYKTGVILKRQIEFNLKFKIFPSITLVCFICTIGLLLLSKGLYQGPLDNDVWEHYLPYYREVIHSGSIWPNEIWGHFYLSKSAGLFFLGALLSDVFAVQLVSLCFIAMTGLIIFHLLKQSLSATLWAILGVTIFFAIYDGSFFKHHAVLTGYIAFLIWAAVQMAQQNAKGLKILWIVVAISSFYITFYIPIIALLLTAFWSIIGIVSSKTQILQCRPRYFITISIFTVLGAGTALIVNYGFTGLAEMVPLSFFWQFADRVKFDSVFGSSGILFFLHEQAGLHSSILDNLKNMPLWIGMVLRLSSLRFIILFSIIYLAFPVVIFLLNKHNTNLSKQLKRHVPLFVILASFILPAITISFFAQVASTYRLFAFTILVTSIILVIFIKLVLEAISRLPLPNWFEVCLLAGLSILALTQAVYITGPRRLPDMVRYAFGRMAFADVIKETDDNFRRPIRLGTFEKIRKKIGSDEPIMTFGYDPAPGYSFPGLGVISEPSYTLGSQYISLIFGEPEHAKILLQAANINYFLIDLRSPLFTGLAFSKLFKAENLNYNFELVGQYDEAYLLTWRNPDSISLLPTELTQIMDLKQTGILFYPFSNDFNIKLEEFVGQKLVSVKNDVDKSIVSKDTEWLNVKLPDEIKKMLVQEIRKRVSLPEDRVLLEGLVNDVIVDLRLTIFDLISMAWAKAQSMRNSNDLFQKKLNHSITENIVDRMKVLFLKKGEVHLGESLIKTLTIQDERIPFGLIYQSPGNVQKILEKSFIKK